MPSLEQLLGPAGALVAVIFGVIGLARVVMVLWAEHLKADADDRTQRDAAIDGWKAQTDATNRLAAAIEARSVDDADRHRKADR
jgi:hypothetical protein